MFEYLSGNMLKILQRNCDITTMMMLKNEKKNYFDTKIKK